MNLQESSASIKETLEADYRRRLEQVEQLIEKATLATTQLSALGQLDEPIIKFQTGRTPRIILIWQKTIDKLEVGAELNIDTGGFFSYHAIERLVSVVNWREVAVGNNLLPYELDKDFTQFLVKHFRT